MTQTYYPFDSGQGANVTETMWGQMAQLWLGTGVVRGKLNQLNTFADSTGMQVKTDTGIAWIQGYFYKNDDLVVLPIATSDPSNPRIDRIVIRLDWNTNTIQLAVLQGIPAVSPTAPALTQNSSRWEISLAQVMVNANATTITSGNITDERFFVKNVNYQSENWTPIVLQSSWVTYNSFPWGQPAFKKTDNNIVLTKGQVKNGASGVVFNYPAGYRPKETKIWNITQGNNGTFRVVLTNDGNLTVDSGVINAYLSLDGIPPFLAEQ